MHHKAEKKTCCGRVCLQGLYRRHGHVFSHDCSHTWLSCWIDYAHVQTCDWRSILRKVDTRRCSCQKGIMFFGREISPDEVAHCCQIHRVHQLYRVVYWWYKYRNITITHTAVIEVTCLNASCCAFGTASTGNEAEEWCGMQLFKSCTCTLLWTLLMT